MELNLLTITTLYLLYTIPDTLWVESNIPSLIQKDKVEGGVNCTTSLYSVIITHSLY